MLIHRCSDCSKLSINRIAADDQAEMVAGVFRTSLELDEITLNHLNHAKIHLLQARDEDTVYTSFMVGSARDRSQENDGVIYERYCGTSENKRRRRKNSASPRILSDGYTMLTVVTSSPSHIGQFHPNPGPKPWTRIIIHVFEHHVCLSLGDNTIGDGFV